MRNLRFCMMYSHYSKDKENTADIKRIGSMHPQSAMKELGINYKHATPQSMGDQWWFWGCDNLPDPLPPFLTDLDLDPMEQIGYGLSQEDAEKIRGYSGVYRQSFTDER